MPWVKGQSGNPGGRPRELDGIQKLARDNGSIAIEVLVNVATNGKSESARVAAANALLDRAFGKPTQVVTGDPSKLQSASEMTDDELAAVIRVGRAA